MSTPCRRRLMRDFKKLQDDPPPGISGAPRESNILVWEAIIVGPPDTPFEDGTFKLYLEFSEEYPNKPPLVRFVSKMFHPNIYNDGTICLDILQNRWSPTYDVSAVLTSVQSLLDEPNPNSPANAAAAEMYQSNRREYERRVQETVELSWVEIGGEDDDDDEDDENKINSSADVSTNTETTPTTITTIPGETQLLSTSNPTVQRPIPVSPPDETLNSPVSE